MNRKYFIYERSTWNQDCMHQHQQWGEFPINSTCSFVSACLVSCLFLARLVAVSLDLCTAERGKGDGCTRRVIFLKLSACINRPQTAPNMQTCSQPCFFLVSALLLYYTVVANGEYLVVSLLASNVLCVCVGVLCVARVLHFPSCAPTFCLSGNATRVCRAKLVKLGSARSCCGHSALLHSQNIA